MFDFSIRIGEEKRGVLKGYLNFDRLKMEENGDTGRPCRLFISLRGDDVAE